MLKLVVAPESPIWAKADRMAKKQREQKGLVPLYMDPAGGAALSPVYIK